MTLNKETLNQNHMRKHLHVIPTAQVVSTEDNPRSVVGLDNLKFGVKKKAFGQTISSDLSQREEVSITAQSLAEPVTAPVAAASVSQMMRMQQIMNASSEKVHRRIVFKAKTQRPDGSPTPQCPEQTQADMMSLISSSSPCKRDNQQEADLYINENTSSNLHSYENHV